MPRRRRPPAPTTTEAVPDELARLEVEDWIDPRRMDPPFDDRHDPDRWLGTAQHRARRLWLAARRDYLEDLDVPPDRWCELVPYQSPVFANESRFRRAIGRRGQ